MDEIHKQLPVIMESFCEEQLTTGRVALKRIRQLQKHINIRNVNINTKEEKWTEFDRIQEEAPVNRPLAHRYHISSKL